MSYDGFNQKVIEPDIKNKIRSFGDTCECELPLDPAALPLIYRPDMTMPRTNRANHEASRQVSPSDQGCRNPVRTYYCLKSRKYR